MTDSIPGFLPGFVHGLEPETHHLWFCVHGTSVMVGPPEDLGLDVTTLHYLGSREGTAVWAAEIAEKPPFPFSDLRKLYGELDEIDWTIAGRAVQIVEWDRTHRFCGRCGTATEHSDNDRSRKCPSCGLLAYPRLAPAIITLVLRGNDEVLLGRGVNFPGNMYSCLAGFVEPGETLEQAVIREIREEVGVEVTNPRYIQSQPWPFPHSLMIGFTCEWVSGEIDIDPAEIADAKWYRRGELPFTPPTMSIAGRLIEAWKAGELTSS
ncbi:MAG: NAD(+) diphosphatase [Acidimicrobiia bacterium]